MGAYFLNWALYEGFAPQSFENYFWEKVNDISGKGYKNRVKECYQDHIYDDSVALAKRVVKEIEDDINKLIMLFPEK